MNCIFSTPILASHFIFLLTIWILVGALHDGKYELYSSPSAAPTTSVMTIRETSTITKSLTVTSLTPTPTNNEVDISTQIENFLSVKANDSALFIGQSISGFQDRADSALEVWNTSVYAQVHSLEQHYKTLLQYNQSIYSSLAMQAARINSSAAFLASNGFLLAEDVQSSLLNNLSLDLTFLNDLFGNTTSNLQRLRNFGPVNLPTVTIKSITSQEVRKWLDDDQTVAKAIAALKIDILHHTNNSKIMRTGRFIKRDSSSRPSNHIKKKAFTLTLILSITLCISILVTMCVEYLSYRYEVRSLQIILQSQLQLFHENAQSNSSPILSRIKCHTKMMNFLQSYNHVSKHPVISAVAEAHHILPKMLFNKLGAYSKETELVKFRIWWVAFSGRNLWYLLLAFYIEGHIFKAFLDTNSASGLYELAKRNEDIIPVSVQASYESVSSSCQTFELVIDSRIKSSLQENVWNSNNGTIAAASESLDRAVAEVVKNIQTELPEFVSPGLILLNDTIKSEVLNFTSFSSLLVQQLFTVFNVSGSTRDHSLLKRSEATNVHLNLAKIGAYYNRGCLCLLGAVIFHLICGLILTAS